MARESRNRPEVSAAVDIICPRKDLWFLIIVRENLRKVLDFSMGLFPDKKITTCAYEAMSKNAVHYFMGFRLPQKDFPMLYNLKKKRVVQVLQASISVPFCCIDESWLKDGDSILTDDDRVSALRRLAKELQLENHDNVPVIQIYKWLRDTAQRYPDMVSAKTNYIESEGVFKGHLFKHRTNGDNFEHVMSHRFVDFPRGHMEFKVPIDEVPDDE